MLEIPERKAGKSFSSKENNQNFKITHVDFVLNKRTDVINVIFIDSEKLGAAQVAPSFPAFYR